MILFLAKLLIARNPAMTLTHARRLVKIGLAVAALVALVGGAALWLHLHDEAVIERHEDKRAKADLQTALDRTNAADAAGEVREQARAAASTTTTDELETIHAEDPAAAQAPASRGARTVARRLPVQP